LLLAIASTLWRHLTEPVSARVRTIFKTRALALFVVPLLITGGCVYYDTNIRNRYETTRERLDRRADYEKRYRSLASTPQPRITDITTRVDIFSDKRLYHNLCLHT